MDWEGTKRKMADGALAAMEAFEAPEVQEAFSAWATATFQVARALERADLSPQDIASNLAGGMMSILRAMDQCE